LQTSWLEVFNLKITSFRLCKIKRLKVSSPWIKREVARIQFNVQISLRLLLSVDQQDLLLGRFLFLSLSVVLQTSDYLGYSQTLLYYPYYFWILKLFVCVFYILCLPLHFWNIKGEYFMSGFFFFYFVYPLYFWDEKGEYCFWTGFVFLTGQVIFSQNSQRGSLLIFLATFCWQNHCHVRLLLYTRLPFYS